ncbi:MAG: hypothetical protein K0R84_2915 [Clostridia bacterium]|jgi:hypothetical protein|nr:hypothetical protein [Clostridia bacterium]
MDSFWSKLLILGIVAAIGVFFIHNVYTPQRSAQEAMAVSTQQSVNAVKAGVDETLSIVSGSQVENIANNNFAGASPKKITITKANGATYTFTDLTSTATDSAGKETGAQTLNAAVDNSKNYKQSTSLETIFFAEQ